MNFFAHPAGELMKLTVAVHRCRFCHCVIFGLEVIGYPRDEFQIVEGRTYRRFDIEGPHPCCNPPGMLFWAQDGPDEVVDNWPTRERVSVTREDEDAART